MAPSAGLQALAENGGVPDLVAELGGTAGFDDVVVAGSAPIGPGDSAEVLVTAGPGTTRLSVAAMLICTNDGFGAVDRIPLPRYGEMTATYGVAFDAGTEINTEDYDDLVPPCDGSGATGTTDPALAEGGVVHRHAAASVEPTSALRPTVGATR